MPRKPSVKDMSAPGDFCILLDAAAGDWQIPGDTPMWKGDTERPTLCASISTAGWHGRLIDGELRPP